MPPLLPTNAPRFRFTLLSGLLGPHVLRTDPLGWNQLGVSLHRDPKTHGMATGYTVQLGFVKDGRAYLERAYQAAGIEAVVTLVVEQYDPNAFAWGPYYRGRVNFVGRELTRLEFRANVEDADFLQKFLNRDAVAVDLFGGTSVGGSAGPAAAPVPVPLHSRALVKRFDGAVGAAPFTTGTGLVFDNDSRSQTFYFGYPVIVRNELDLKAIAGGFVTGGAFGAVPIFPVPDSGEYVVELGAVVDVAVHDPVNPLLGFGFAAVDYKFHYRINGNPATATPLAVGGFAGAYRQEWSHRVVIPPTAFTEQLEPGDKIYLYAEVYVHQINHSNYAISVTATEQPGTYLRITATTKTAPTTTYGLLAYEALDRLAQALTDEADAFRSTYFGRPDTRHPQPFDGPGALLLLTGGFQVRGFPMPAAPAPAAAGAPDPRKTLTATWRDTWESLDAVHGLGYGVEPGPHGRPVLRVEPAAYFYPARVALDLTAAGPVAVSSKVLAERCYQSLEFGYPTWQAEAVNGLDEPNAPRQWSTPLTTVNNPYARRSPFVASGQLLEVTRRQRYQNSETTDAGTDARTFLVALRRTPATTLAGPLGQPPLVVPAGFAPARNEEFTRLEGVLDPASLYNADLTPARCLRRHGAQVRAGLEPAGAHAVRFAAGQGNNALVSQRVGETAPVAESGDVAVADLAAPLWRCEADVFTVAVGRAQLQALLADPLGRVRYLGPGGAVREGWVLDFAHHGPDQLGEFTLLPCADSL